MSDANKAAARRSPERVLTVMATLTTASLAAAELWRLGGGGPRYLVLSGHRRAGGRRGR